MKKKYYYLSSLVLIFVIPASIAGYFILPYIAVPRLLLFVAIIAVVGSLWDLWATRHGTKDPVWLWNFNSRETLGIKFLGLPIEEYLFYVCSSVYVVFGWEILSRAFDTGDSTYYILIPALGLWTLASLIVPYHFTSKGDKVIG